MPGETGLFEDDRKRIKEVVTRLTVIRMLDRVALRIALDCDDFETRILNPLKEICDWSLDDDREASQHATELREELEGTIGFKAKQDLVKRALTFGGGIAAGISLITLGAAVTRLLKKKKP